MQPAPLVASLALAFVATASQAGELADWFDRARTEVADSYRFGTTEYYMPLYTWHLPWAYTREQISEYQNHPYGFGLGRGRFDDRGNWHGVYAMGFQDSHFKPEWLVGYGWKTYWRTSSDVRLGLGYTAGFTSRTDYGHYAPLPVLLPIASADYGKLSLETAYVPGGQGFGNIFFIWAKWRTDDKRILGWGKP